MASRGPLPLLRNLPAPIRGPWSVFFCCFGSSRAFCAGSSYPQRYPKQHVPWAENANARDPWARCRYPQTAVQKSNSADRGPWSDRFAQPLAVVRGAEKTARGPWRSGQKTPTDGTGSEKNATRARGNSARLNSMFFTDISQFLTYLCDKSYKGTQGTPMGPP